MKYSIIVAIAIASIAKAQMPACAKTCLADAVKSSTSCGATDIACQCLAANKLLIQTAATPCVLTSCGDQALEVLGVANADCVAAEILSKSTTAAPTSTSSRLATTTSSTQTPSSSTTQSSSPTSSKQPDELSLPTPSPSSSSTATQPTNLAQTPNPSSDPKNSLSISSASPGVKAGIAIGAIAAVAIIGLLIWIVFLLRKRHKMHDNGMDRRDGEPRGTAYEVGGAGGGTELPATSVIVEKGEMDGIGRARGKEVELPG